MDNTQIWASIDEQRADLADFLDTLTAQQWATASLCPGWTVRDVAVHVTQSATPWGRLTFELARSGFRFNAVMLRMARDDREIDGVKQRQDREVQRGELFTIGHGQRPRR